MAATAHSRPPMAHASHKYGVSYSGTNSMTKPAMVATIMMQAHKPLVSADPCGACVRYGRGHARSPHRLPRAPRAARRSARPVYIARRAAASVRNDFTLVAFSNRLLARIVVVGDVQPPSIMEPYTMHHTPTAMSPIMSAAASV